MLDQIVLVKAWVQSDFQPSGKSVGSWKIKKNLRSHNKI